MGEYDASKFELGEFILADEWRNLGGARGSGRGSVRGSGVAPFGRGFGRRRGRVIRSRMSHLLFSNDYLVFTHTSTEASTILHTTLKIY